MYIRNQVEDCFLKFKIKILILNFFVHLCLKLRRVLKCITILSKNVKVAGSDRNKLVAKGKYQFRNLKEILLTLKFYLMEMVVIVLVFQTHSVLTRKIK